jgi:hypothetical protein
VQAHLGPEGCACGTSAWLGLLSRMSDVRAGHKRWQCADHRREGVLRGRSHRCVASRPSFRKHPEALAFRRRRNPLGGPTVRDRLICTALAKRGVRVPGIRPRRGDARAWSPAYRRRRACAAHEWDHGWHAPHYCVPSARRHAAQPRVLRAGRSAVRGDVRAMDRARRHGRAARRVRVVRAAVARHARVRARADPVWQGSD